MEITSNAQAARLLSWALRKHTFISYAMYTAGAKRGLNNCLLWRSEKLER